MVNKKTNAFQQAITFPQGKLPPNHRVYLKSEICQPTLNPYESATADVTLTPSEVFSCLRVIEEEGSDGSHGVTSSVNIQFENKVNLSLPMSFRSNLVS